MTPINFDESNFTFAAPSGMDKCDDLKVFKGLDENGYPIVISCWELSDEEVEYILINRKVWLGMVSKQVPPAWIIASHPFEVQNNNNDVS